MAVKQSVGRQAPDGSIYATATNGDDALYVVVTTSTVTAKPSRGVQAPDGSTYMTLTNGNGTLV